MQSLSSQALDFLLLCIRREDSRLKVSERLVVLRLVVAAGASLPLLYFLRRRRQSRRGLNMRPKKGTAGGEEQHQLSLSHIVWQINNR